MRYSHRCPQGALWPERVKDAQRKLDTDNIACAIMDIKGCFPNMPKETIRFAIRDIFKQHQKSGKKGVSVPRRSTSKKPCLWKQRDDCSYVWLPFGTILDVLDFSLDQAVFLRLDGEFLRQKKGIPMGDALSPGMTIGTCGWMEHEWMCGLDLSLIHI